MWKKTDEPAAVPPAQPITHYPPPAPVATPTPQPRTAVVGPSMSVHGEFSGAEDLVIEGYIEGTIELKQNSVTVGKSGRVHADITARVIRIEGEVDGDVVASEQIIIAKTGKITGNVHGPRLSLEEGAQMKGQVSTDQPAATKADSSAKRESNHEVKSPPKPARKVEPDLAPLPMT